MGGEGGPKTKRRFVHPVKHAAEDPGMNDPTKGYIPEIKKDGKLLGDNWKDRPLHRRLNYLHLTLLVATPLLAVYGLLTTTFNIYTWIWAVVYYFATGLGITAGYHRLFSHRAYKAGPFVHVLMLALGSGAVQGSVRWWCRDHRAHHRYVDTEKDPYAVTNGFFYAHMGWMLIKQDPKKIGRADITDLNTDALIRWQHRNYPLCALVMGFLVPTLVAGLWGDFRGGYFIAGVARLVFVHHSTFFVNSLAHWAGDKDFSDWHTARNSVITALLTIGEGYHNFHHEFPEDYRNGVRYYQYDPTKWLIAAFEKLGLVTALKRFPENEIKKGELQMKQKALNDERKALGWGGDPDALPVYNAKKLAATVDSGRVLLVLDGFVIDATEFAHEHPGGAAMVRVEAGKDITAKFRGGVYAHSNAAVNFSSSLRVGVFKE